MKPSLDVIFLLVTHFLVATPALSDPESSTALRSDRQTSTFLAKGETKVLTYWSSVAGSYLSITVTPCTARLHWTVHYSATNDTTGGGKVLYETRGHAVDTWREKMVPRGVYWVRVTAEGAAGAAHVYTSTEPGGPQALVGKVPRLRLNQRRQRNGRLMVKWNQSAVDPHVTQYCLVVSTTRNYSSLCEAQGEHPGVMTLPPVTRSKHQKKAILRAGPIMRSPNGGNDEDILIACVGSRLQYTITNLEQGRVYHFNLFAINRQTNFSFPFGSNVLKFDRKLKPQSLRDGKPAFVNLKKMDGKAVFRYKISARAVHELVFYVMPCGGGVEVEVLLQRNRVVQRRRVDGYGRLVVRAPAIGQRYYIRVTSANREELRRTSGVEVLATVKPNQKFPLPSMPHEARVYQYSAECDAVTVGWLPTLDPKGAHYCVQARQGDLRELDGPRMANQCGLETRMRKSADFAVKYCQDYSGDHNRVITQRIAQLKPGQRYVVQVTVRKPQGKTLAYDLLQVHTKPKCHQNNTY